METKKPLYGMLIQRNNVEETLFSEKNKETNYEVIYSISTMRFPTNKLLDNQWFVTNRAINAEIIKFISTHPPESPNIASHGKITIAVYPKKRLIRTEDYRPPSRIYLEKKGLATLAELVMEKDLLRALPNYKISTTNYPSSQRQEQIKKRGRRIGKALPLAKAVELTRRQAIRQYRKNKPEREVINIFGKFRIPNTTANRMHYEKGLLATQIKNRPMSLKIFDKAKIRVKNYLTKK